MKKYDFEKLLYNADGLWVDNAGFSMLNEEDEYNEKYEKVYFTEWCDIEGLEYTIKFTDTAIKNAKIVDAENGVITVKDIYNNDVQIQILKAVKL